MTLYVSPDRLPAFFQLAFDLLSNGDGASLVQTLANGRLLKARRRKVVSSQFCIIGGYSRLGLCKKLLAPPTVLAIDVCLFSLPCFRKHARRLPSEREVVSGV